MRKHEKIFKREDGTQYKIEVEIIVDRIDGIEFRHWVTTKEKNKRKWKNIVDKYSDDWELRKLSWEEKQEHYKNTFLQYVTAEEILNVKLELWKNIQPKL
jgi:hypothetical protein